MSKPSVALVTALVLCLLASARADESVPGSTVAGDLVDPSAFGPGVVEDLDAVLARERELPPSPPRRQRNGAQGEWYVPGLNATYRPHTGSHYAINKWGDTRMGIGFPMLVDVHGAYFAGQASPEVWTTGLRVVGYRAGQEVQASEWFRGLAAEPTWVPLELRAVDRIEVQCEPVVGGAGWYALDDLTFSAHSAARVPASEITVVDFEEVGYNTTLTGSGYAGLIWETGTGDFGAPGEIHAPLVPPGAEEAKPPAGPGTDRDEPPLRAGTAPSMTLDFQAGLNGDASTYVLPPDSMGAIGPSHYMEVVNNAVSFYNKSTGARLGSPVRLQTFFPGSPALIGDPRVLFDQHSGRWIVTATDFDQGQRIWLGVSLTDNPTSFFYKTSFQTDQGDDAGKWPDFPTLGVDQHGIYVAAFMVGGLNRMTLWAIDKAPLLQSSPSLGTVTAFRLLLWEGAIQPAHTYGTPAGEYLVSRYDTSRLRIRRLNPPLTAPTLTNLGTVSVGSNTTPPNAPALGSTTLIDTGDARPQAAIYRDGSLWTCHTIAYNTRAACRWYQINPATLTLQQSGTVADSSLYYYYPSLAVNSAGDVVMGFTGSNAGQYCATYYTGRKATDPAGQMAPPVLYKAGQGAYNMLDGSGRNRWGDYSATTVDPADGLTFWTIQEYTHATDVWGTWVARLAYLPPEEACCLPSGACSDLEPAACAAAGGVPQGVGTACATASCPACRGDANCDGAITFADIDPFVTVLSGGTPCRFENCDANGDGLINFDDIDPFVTLLSSGTTCPNP